MIIEEKLKREIFSTNKYDNKEVKSLIARKGIFNLENRLKTIKQIMDLY